MSSIIREGDTYHGISVAGRGLFTNRLGEIYAGQCKNGYACGLGVSTKQSRSACGGNEYAEYGPDGNFDGRCFGSFSTQLAAGSSLTYALYERGESKETAWEANEHGERQYNGRDCDRNDPRLLALIARVAPVRVRPTAPAPQPPSPATGPQAIARWMRRLILHSQALAAAVATEVHPHAARRRWWFCATQPNSSRTAKHDHAATRARADLP
jgi:hypothetical protein